jgi:pSer/pThr/pTyr-binding forkhead associated (FHA) protein
MFSRRGLQYVDLSSANGSFIDGLRIQPDTPLDVHDSSLLTIGPYQITVRLELVPLTVAPSDPDATTDVLGEGRLPAIAWVDAWKETLARSEAIHRILAQHGPADILGRAAEMIEAVADLVIRFRGPAHSGSALTVATAADEIVAYLLDPEAERERVGELRTLLAEMLRFPMTVVSGGTS